MKAELETAHRERIQLLNQRYDCAIGDDGQNKIQELIDAENLRWKIYTDSQPQPK
ncbi:MAG TPA: hypothetical protein VHY30_04510 [Verrucomicrobiae bacterium]|jgi:hypothetical protein|nr:hypothetical protein [Verrucomicrobiae bacterium]